MSKKITTIKEIAQQLNISISTVSRALNNHPSIGANTKAAVKKKAEELNYHPNQTAISFKSSRTNTIGVIVPNLKEEFFVSILAGIEGVLRQQNYIALITQSHDSMNLEKELVASMLKYRVDGLLVSLAKDNDSLAHFEKLNELDLPIVYFDRVPLYQDINYIMCSIFHSTVEMIQSLNEKGHQRIALILGPENFPDKNERWMGYKEGLKKINLDYLDEYVQHTDFTYTSTLNAINHLMKLQEPPTVIITVNDYVALDAFKILKSYNTPVDIASYANISFIEYLEKKPVISIEQFPTSQGKKAAGLLLELIRAKEEQKKPAPQQIVLRSKLIQR
ncbi:LacI family DNA-binding transcriptional regulator [Gynurincola endophyticus]|uniref:LacI family DNA-binding transcriptional regulator n=1 Tax=Gynurincola endophyticus TaxID=2479004 RepID=UPI000F8F8007|nr:LacI family DNA-binding transcriptional regulator [Gynurincola endophyticus]